MNRLLKWDPFRIRINADAVAELIGGRALLAFQDGFIEIAAGPLRGQATIEVTPPNDVRLAVSVNGAPPGVVVDISLASLLPPFIDLRIADAAITKDGILISLGEGGADPP